MDFSSRRYANSNMPKLLYAIHLMGGLIAGVAWVVLALRIFRRFFCSDGQGWGMLTRVNTPAVQDGLESLFGADSGKTMKTVGLRRGAIGNGIKASDMVGSFRNLTGRLEIRFVFALSVLFCAMAVAIYITRPPVRLPAMEPVLYAPNAELLRHPSNRPSAGCDVDYETSSCPLWYRSTEN
jgi:hypothetical protein